MKGLVTLIKLHKRTLDALRRKMTSLESQKAQLQLASKRLSEELKREMEMASKQADMAQFFGGFAKRIKKRQDDLAQEIRVLDAQMVKLQAEIVDAFREVKKFEIAQENIKKRAEEETKRKDTIALDEIAGQQHRRKHEET